MLLPVENTSMNKTSQVNGTASTQENISPLSLGRSIEMWLVWHQQES
jgi:hypothetical protein